MGVREDQSLSASQKSKFITKKKKYLFPAHTHVIEDYSHFPLHFRQPMCNKRGKNGDVVEQMTLFERPKPQAGVYGRMQTETLLRGKWNAC